MVSCGAHTDQVEVNQFAMGTDQFHVGTDQSGIGIYQFAMGAVRIAHLLFILRRWCSAGVHVVEVHTARLPFALHRRSACKRRLCNTNTGSYCRVRIHVAYFIFVLHSRCLYCRLGVHVAESVFVAQLLFVLQSCCSYCTVVFLWFSYCTVGVHIADLVFVLDTWCLYCTVGVHIAELVWRSYCRGLVLHSSCSFSQLPTAQYEH